MFKKLTRISLLSVLCMVTCVAAFISPAVSRRSHMKQVRELQASDGIGFRWSSRYLKDERKWHYSYPSRMATRLGIAKLVEQNPSLGFADNFSRITGVEANHPSKELHAKISSVVAAETGIQTFIWNGDLPNTIDLSRNKNLYRIQLTKCNVPKEFLQRLRKTNLFVITLYECDISAQAVEELRKINSLKAVVFHTCHVDPKEIAVLKEELTDSYVVAVKSDLTVGLSWQPSDQ